MCVLSERGAGESQKQDGEGHVPHTAEQDVRAQLSRAERDLGRRIDPGRRALVITGVMLVLVLCSLLPWIGGATGWQVLVGSADPALNVGLLPRLFAINSGIAGVLISTLALTTRRWALSFVAALACGVVALEGLIAIWARQTVPQAGPSVGLVLAAICMFVLVGQWLRIAWSRP
ncbi:hypothetical protein DFQ14_105164 [Halopolyspora algeriensis]|uniref:Uncharacterized protein n=1 Tax=Halopolyspora algeriensis TaxID=1500506 RepID=A0A368VQ90_9ACTN|nr:hypothetical protein [Halopolyspora algeriensis]RCW44019.1 hypothetical protein DFQ14_105164 [Halopolyspora algeriensis]TQM53478.1 hypothetical protein FHU43_1634 [Halopolyspora algeriensis]